MSLLLLHVLARSPWQGGRLAVAGLRGQPLRWIAAGSVGAWATAWDTDSGGKSPALTREDLLASHDLADAAWNAAPCLPVRLPTWLPDEAAAVRALATQAPAIEQRVEEVGGHAELALTAFWVGEGASPPRPLRRLPPSPVELERGSDGGKGEATPGRRYMEARRAAWRRQEGREAASRALVAEVERELAPWLRAAQHTFAPREAVAFSSALLVTREGASAAAERTRATAAGWQGVRGVVSGPWPPYSFAALDVAAPGEAPGLALAAGRGAHLAVTGDETRAPRGDTGGRADG